MSGQERFDPIVCPGMIRYRLLVRRIDLPAQDGFFVRLPNMRSKSTQVDFCATQGIMRIIFAVSLAQLRNALAIQNERLMPEPFGDSHEFKTVASSFADDDAAGRDFGGTFPSLNMVLW